MSSFRASPLLRNTLIADAAASGATALVAMAGADILQPWLGLPAVLLRGAGLVLIPYVAYVIFLATRRHPTAGGVWAVITANAAWTAASLLLLASGWVAPTALGYTFIVAQALIVATLGELQYMALRRPGTVEA